MAEGQAVAVELRSRSESQAEIAARWYRIARRETRQYAGPVPRIRQRASDATLTASRAAAARGVRYSPTVGGAAGEACTLLSTVHLLSTGGGSWL